MIKHIRKEDLSTKTWSGGTTTQLYIYPESSDYKALNFDFRISTATVEVETSNFTKLSGINRLIMSLDGPLSLMHNDGPMIDLLPFEVDAFTGDDETISFGQVTDFNVMFTRDYKASLKRVESEIIKTHITCLYAFDDPSKLTIDNQVYRLEEGEMLIIMDDQEIQISEPLICVQLQKN
ncbi:HutD family protein [Acidaminobacter sp. JC074]|uniref:HutD/Ves family protein n=1 Tax=Acidaminobacter sp. JC074 TaxID=2530199 RepID=UPI001F0F63D6|nr:HutD family protein [Acidaminobacter sp. JC074]MCH4890031.1 HutD family protein [Acidaminobacter sp. JC074]